MKLLKSLFFCLVLIPPVSGQNVSEYVFQANGVRTIPTTIMYDGNVLVGGFCDVPSYNNGSALLMKTDAALSQTWAYTYANLGNECFTNILKIPGNTNYLVQGSYSTNGGAVILAMIDSAGTVISSVKESSVLYNFPGKFVLSGDSGIYGCWHSFDSVVIARFNYQLQAEWSYVLRSTNGRMYAPEIRTDSDHGIYMYSYQNFSSQPHVQLKFDRNGNLLWYNEPKIPGYGIMFMFPNCWEGGYVAACTRAGGQNDISLIFSDTSGNVQASFVFPDATNDYELFASEIINDTILMLTGTFYKISPQGFNPFLARINLRNPADNNFTTYNSSSWVNEFRGLYAKGDTLFACGFQSNPYKGRLLKTDHISLTCSGTSYTVLPVPFQPLADTLTITKDTTVTHFSPYPLTRTNVNILQQGICVTGNAPEPELKTTVQLAPNPARDKVYLHAADQLREPVILQLRNMTGQVLRELKYSGGMLEIDITGLEAGIYLINGNNNQIRINERIIITR